MANFQYHSDLIQDQALFHHPSSPYSSAHHYYCTVVAHRIWSDWPGFCVLCKNVGRPIKLQEQVFVVNEPFCSWTEWLKIRICSSSLPCRSISSLCSIKRCLALMILFQGVLHLGCSLHLINVNNLSPWKCNILCCWQLKLGSIEIFKPVYGMPKVSQFTGLALYGLFVGVTLLLHTFVLQSLLFCYNNYEMIWIKCMSVLTAAALVIVFCILIAHCI